MAIYKESDENAQLKVIGLKERAGQGFFDDNKMQRGASQPLKSVYPIDAKFMDKLRLNEDK